MTKMSSYLYVPILKWRMGEYQSLLRMRSDLKPKMLPLIELCPPEYDFEAEQLKKTIDEQLATFAQRLKQKWADRLAFVDGLLLEAGDRMKNGEHPMTFIFASVRGDGGRIIPVTGLDRDEAYQGAVKVAAKVDGLGVCLRVGLDEVADETFGERVEALLASLGVQLAETDIILDLRAANFEPVAALATLVGGLIEASTVLAAARSLVFAGTAFPASMGAVKTRITKIKRSEWLAYKALVAALPEYARRPLFGDYAIAGPERVSIDMRKVKPAASVRYASHDIWLVAKGSNVRDNGFGQFRELCKEIAESDFYLGREFSKGSEHVYDCAFAGASTGNLTTWRWVGTNQHMTKVLDDLATFADS
jgi:hypothetical protein